MMFDPYVAEKLGWYVYALRNPLDGRVFYVGKGVGNRVFQHAREAIALQSADEDLASQKIGLIKSIHAAGQEVEVFLLRYQLPTESQAYEVEAAVIDALRLLDYKGDNDLFTVTNVVLGHHHLERGLAPAHVAASRFKADPMPELTESVIIFGIPKLWTPSMGQAEIYDAVRGWWLAGSRAPRATHVLAAHHNVVRGAFRVDYWRERVPGDRDWQEDIGGKPRIGFHGSPAPELEQVLHKSVKHIPVGGSIRYVGCDAKMPAVRTLYRGEEALARAKLEGVVT